MKVRSTSKSPYSRGADLTETERTTEMSAKEKVQKELNDFLAWTQEANMQAHLAASEANSELRKVWMETEQNIAKLQARLSDAGAGAELELESLIANLKQGWEKLKDSRK